MRRLLPTFLLWVLVWSWVGRVHAATVMILEPARTSAATTEALFRLQGELLAVGLEVETAARPPSSASSADPRLAMERLADERRVIAILDLIGDVAPLSVEIWIFQRGPQRPEVSRVVLNPDAATGSETLAIRAIEVLRSRFLELDLGAPRRKPEPEATLPPAAPPSALPDSAPPARFALAAGLAMLTSVDRVGPALLPLLGLDWRANGWLVVQARWGGPGTHPSVEGALGSAKLAQQYGIIGLCYCANSHAGLHPVVSLSAGVLHTSVDGQAMAPQRGHAVRQWSALLDAGLGAQLHLSERYFLTLASHVQLAEPYVAVHFVDELVATSGRPNLLFPFTFGAWL
jgi:hypothetical protein